MNSPSLLAILTLTGALCGTSLVVQAQQTESEPKGGSLHPSELKVGEKAPGPADRASEAVDWKARGLPEPAKESQWVRIDDRYVRVQISNGRIMEILPAKR